MTAEYTRCALSLAQKLLMLRGEHEAVVSDDTPGRLEPSSHALVFIPRGRAWMMDSGSNGEESEEGDILLSFPEAYRSKA